MTVHHNFAIMSFDIPVASKRLEPCVVNSTSPNFDTVN